VKPGYASEIFLARRLFNTRKEKLAEVEHP